MKSKTAQTGWQWIGDYWFSFLVLSVMVIVFCMASQIWR